MDDRFYAKTLAVLPEEAASLLRRLPPEQQRITQEIRLRIDRPLSVVLRGESWFVAVDGRACREPSLSGFTATRELLEETFLRLCGYSVHSHQQEIARGYITTRQGDRAGVCASAVVSQGGTVSYRDISSINLRVSRELPGCANSLLQRLDPRRGILLAGMPSSGKTTLLRDFIRGAASGSVGSCLKVAVVDERYELSAAGQGAPLYDLGLCSDLLCGKSKAEAIEQAVRTLSPDLVACDEIGSSAEIAQLEAGLCSGVAFLATVHCGNRNELFASQRIRRLMDTGAFGQLVLLDSSRFPGKTDLILTAEGYYAEDCWHTAAL